MIARDGRKFPIEQPALVASLRIWIPFCLKDWTHYVSSKLKTDLEFRSHKHFILHKEHGWGGMGDGYMNDMGDVEEMTEQNRLCVRADVPKQEVLLQ